MLYRYNPYGDFTEGECEVCSKYFDVVESRCHPKVKGKVVIGRYSCLPHYSELVRDLSYVDAGLINTYEQHLYVADLARWYEDLKESTPKTWFRLEDLPDDIGPVVLKGQTNSKKFQWRTAMYASNKRDAIQVYLRLREDFFLQDQGIYIREFVPLRNYFSCITGLPVTKEYRFFVLNKEILAGGYYWSNHVDELENAGIFHSDQDVPREFLEKIVSIVGDKCMFYVLDVGQLDNGEWVVIELNDGQQSGLSEVDPDKLYRNLKLGLSRFFVE